MRDFCDETETDVDDDDKNFSKWQNSQIRPSNSNVSNDQINQIIANPTQGEVTRWKRHDDDCARNWCLLVREVKVNRDSVSDNSKSEP